MHVSFLRPRRTRDAVNHAREIGSSTGTSLDVYREFGILFWRKVCKHSLNEVKCGEELGSEGGVTPLHECPGRFIWRSSR